MKCPVCGRDCVQSAKDILATLPTVFLPVRRLHCPDSRQTCASSSLEYAEPCSCGKRFIDDVFAHLYVIMVEEGDLKANGSSY